MWYFEKVLKIQVKQDMCYAEAGSVVHKILENYYNNVETDREKIKLSFDKLWKQYKLNESKIALMKPEYWLMIINGIELGITVTSTELKIYYPDIICFIDVVDSENLVLRDWKSSKRREENEIEYLQQLKLYSWVYYRKFGVIPKKVVVHYLRYQGDKGELILKPTIDDIEEIAKWYNKIRKEMEYIIEKKELPNKCENCFMFCPYKDVCDNYENKLIYKLYLNGNYITVVGHISELLNKGLTKKFSYKLKDAYFIKKARPQANTTINFWNTNTHRLPIGFFEGLKKTLSDYAEYKKKELILKIIEERVFDNTKVEMPDKFINDKVLRDYQIKAVETFLENKIGALELGTGAGKTEIAIEIIRRLKMKTLFIVDKVELLRQTKKRIEDSLGIEVGVIGAGEKDVKDITVATIQTLIKNKKEYLGYLNSIRFCIFDECHKTSAMSYWKIAHTLINSEYRAGLSGTIFRDDGNDMYIQAVTGNIIMNLGTNILIEKGWLVKPKIIFIKDYMNKDEINSIEDSCKLGLINETEKYNIYYNKFIVENKLRNNIIMNIANENNKNNKKTLILVKLVDHGKYLEEQIPHSKYLYGGTNKTERKKILEDFTTGKLNILIGTISIFSEGLDIPILDTVLNAAANKGNVKTIQVLGRVLRILEGKEDALYYDFYDNGKFVISASISRIRALRREGHNVEVKSAKT